MRRFSALDDKMHRKLVARGVPGQIAAFVSDDANGFPHSSRKFLAKAIIDDFAAYMAHYGNSYGFQSEEESLAAYLEGHMDQLMMIRDWLAMGDEEDGSSINMHLHQTFEEMEVAAEKWHERLREQTEGKGHPALYGGNFADNVMMQFPDGYKMMNVPDYDLENEGNLMGHCVGTGDTYKKRVRSGDTKILSLRDQLGWPHVTMELGVNPRGGGHVRQIQARGDKPPKDKYKSYLRDFLKANPEVEVDKNDRLMLTPTAELLEELKLTDSPEILYLIDEEERVPYYIHKLEQSVAEGGVPFENLWSQFETQSLPNKIQKFAVSHPEIDVCRKYVVDSLRSEYGVHVLMDMGQKAWDGSENIFAFLPHEEAMKIVKRILLGGEAGFVKSRVLSGIPEEIRLSPAFRDTFLAASDWDRGKQAYGLLRNADKMDVEDIVKILRHYALVTSPTNDPIRSDVTWGLMDLRRKDPEKFLAVIDMLPDLAEAVLGDNPVFMHRREPRVEQMQMYLDDRTEEQKRRELEEISRKEDRILKHRMDQNYRQDEREKKMPQTQQSLVYASTRLDEAGMHGFSDRLDSLLFG